VEGSFLEKATLFIPNDGNFSCFGPLIGLVYKRKSRKLITSKREAQHLASSVPVLVTRRKIFLHGAHSRTSDFSSFLMSPSVFFGTIEVRGAGNRVQKTPEVTISACLSKNLGKGPVYKPVDQDTNRTAV